jgi:GcrA cell cycle regulator
MRTRKPALAAACARPVERVVSRPKKSSKAAAKLAAAPARELTKRELYAMLANAVRNTG